MTRRDFGKPAFSLRKKSFVKTHALSLDYSTPVSQRWQEANLTAAGYIEVDRNIWIKEDNIVAFNKLTEN